MASITTRGFFPARAITARSAAGLFVIRTVSSLRPSSVIRTSTLRRRCRSIPTTCRPSYASVIVGLLFPGGDGCLPASSIRQERRPAPSSHQCTRDQLRVEVHDTSPSLPVLMDTAVDATDGRGLVLVAALSAQWGAYRTPAGKVVYFTLAFQPDPAGSGGRGGARSDGDGQTDERTWRAS